MEPHRKSRVISLQARAKREDKAADDFAAMAEHFAAHGADHAARKLHAASREHRVNALKIRAQAVLVNATA